MVREKYARVQYIWLAPGFNSEPLDFYLGEAIVGQRLCKQIDQVVDLMPRPYAFVKKSSLGSKINLLKLDWEQLALDADSLETASRNLLAKFKI